MKTMRYFTIIVLLAMMFLASAQTVRAENDAIIIGLDADMSSGSAESGEAIRRGALLAIDEINKNGGVLGKPLELVVRDHRGNPARGIDNIEEFAQMEDLVAVIGGLHTPVAMAELETIHRRRIIYLDPWAAGTPVIENGYNPNYAFRVSVRDEYAGGFLVGEAIRLGYQHLGLLLEQTAWGRSNHQAMALALQARGLEPADVQWFHWGSKEFTDQINTLHSAGADVVILVANAPEGIVVVQSMAALPEARRLPIISHWGITGGDFFQQTREHLAHVDLVFLHTFSFIAPPFPDRAQRVVEAYGQTFPEAQSSKDIFSPAGTAHAYDLVHLLRLAIEKAGTIDRAAVRAALEDLGEYQGLVRNYNPPFTPENHDALNADDFRIARYDEHGVIVPIK